MFKEILVWSKRPPLFLSRNGYADGVDPAADDDLLEKRGEKMMHEKMCRGWMMMRRKEEMMKRIVCGSSLLLD